MTQGRDGISLAPTGARRELGVARPLSMVLALLVIAGLTVGTAGTSFAKSKHKITGSGTGLLDEVVVTNFGAIFNGSLETFGVGTKRNGHPIRNVKGTDSFLSIGPNGDAVSSVDGHIAVAEPFDFVGQTAPIGPPVGCGPFGFPATAPLFGTGMVSLFGNGSSGNSAPEAVLCSPNFAVGAPNTTGIFFPRGVAFEDPDDGFTPDGTEILAVANALPEVTQDGALCTGSGLGATALGTVTIYDRAGFETGTPGLNNVPPFFNNPVSAVNILTTPPTVYTQNSSIGGCLTSMASPSNLTFDQDGFLYVVNNAPLLAAALEPSAGIPRLINVYQPDAAEAVDPPFSTGDVFPVAIIGLAGTETGGDVVNPYGIATVTFGFEETATIVSDTGSIIGGGPAVRPSIQIYDTFTNSDPLIGFAFAGELVSEITGKNTKLNDPAGIAIATDADTLYVVNNRDNTLLMYTNFLDVLDSEGPLDIAPTLLITGTSSKMQLPVDVALPGLAGSPSGTPTEVSAQH